MGCRNGQDDYQPENLFRWAQQAPAHSSWACLLLKYIERVIKLALNIGGLFNAGGNATLADLGRVRVTIKPLSALPTAAAYGVITYFGVRAMTYNAPADEVRSDVYSTVNTTLAAFARKFAGGLDTEAFTLFSGFTVAKSRIAQPIVDWLLGDAEDDVPSASSLGAAAIGIAVLTGALYMIDLETSNQDGE